GILRVNKKELESIADGKLKKTTPSFFGRAEGMASPVCVGTAQPSGWKSKDGRLWFATTKGLAVTDPQLDVGRNATPPPVLVQQVLADRKPMNVSSHALEIPAGRGELE